MDRWEWQHPDVEGLEARRRRWFVVSGLLVVLAMVAAGWSQRDAGGAGLFLSVVTGPGILAIVLFGCGWAFYTLPLRFRLTVTPDGILRAGSTGRGRSVQLAGAAAVEVRNAVGTSSTGSRAVSTRTWLVTVRTPDGQDQVIPLPGSLIGARMLTDQQAQDLQEHLRWFAGLPNRWTGQT